MAKSPWSAPADKGATGQAFEIRTVEDFFAVPADRRRICLREFHSWLGMHEGIVELLSAWASVLHGAEGEQAIRAAIRSDRDVFKWIDDGEAKISVTMNTSQPAPPASPEGAQR